MKRYREIVVLGAAESGTGAAVLAQKKGLKVFVSDKGAIKETYKSVLIHFDIDFEEGNHDTKRILEADEVIKSPGIPDTIPLIEAIRRKNIPVISEIEFAARYTSAKLIGITGSNGKTTTTLLLGYILKTAGLNVGVAGNIGKSFAWQVAEDDKDVFVLELSSFQLDGMQNFKADISILLNITPDHLDRYDNKFENYINSKFRILQNQSKNDAIIYCFDEQVIVNELAKMKIGIKQFPFSLKYLDVANGAYINKGKLIIKHHKKEFDMTLEQLALQGKHNVYNSMAAGVAAKLMEIRNDTIKQCLSDFQNIAHRLEYVGSVHGIRFINDSKATNVNSTWYALESAEHPTVWIAGGIDKGNDYNSIKSLVKQKVKAIVCLGLDNHKIHEAFADDVELIFDTETAEEAVQAAYQIASKGDTVLMSPACASFDLFENYEDRGNQFKQAVNNL
ncbi:MAG: UDP-N-acetylmuramoyl-L-alanine--D-glutamate ligase [Bacteroidales bacterium]|jgi:UDP-N-acetylmuramoylalanine--D-glutamate ligase|nr:UDP-N-acetylmuramoyl-L-alanine--D-glutamate ligase [Bacteroidales bacterium]